MTKLTRLFEQKARQDFRIYKMKKIAPDTPEAVEFLNHRMTEIKTDIEAAIRKSKHQITLRVITPAKQKLVYEQEAAKMIRAAYEQIHVKCDNCRLYKNYCDYSDDKAEELDLCENLKIQQKIKKGFVKKRNLQAIQTMPLDEFCNKYTPIDPEKQTFPNIEKMVAEIKEWLNEAIPRIAK